MQRGFLRSRERGRRGITSDRGFTLIELLIALTVMLIGTTGILGIQVSALRATSYSRHLTEASVLAEDKVEELRTVPAVNIVNGNETVDGQGNLDPNGLFTRTWTITWNGTVGTLTILVSWIERGGAPRTVRMQTQRTT